MTQLVFQSFCTKIWTNFFSNLFNTQKWRKHFQINFWSHFTVEKFSKFFQSLFTVENFRKIFSNFLWLKNFTYSRINFFFWAWGVKFDSKTGFQTLLSFFLVGLFSRPRYQKYSPWTGESILRHRSTHKRVKAIQNKPNNRQKIENFTKSMR